MTLLLLLTLAGQIPGAVAIDPALAWYTVETEHFAVHFSSRERTRPDEDAEQLARRIAQLCEQAHAALVPLAGWAPRARTDVVVADFFDYANGWASPLPRNTITIIPTLPAGSRVGYDDWLRKLIIHEYAHILQMDMVRGVSAFLRRVFGRIIVTNPLMPYWHLEGWAIKAETDLTGFGRFGSTEFDMMLRAAADSNRLLPIDRTAHYSLERYPAGNAPYLYGGSFYRWAEENYGDTIWPLYHRRRSGGLPFIEEPHARRVFGRSFPALWRDWLDGVRRHADTVGRRLTADRLTPFRPVTAEGFATGSPVWSRSGREIYYFSRNSAEYPGIKAIEPATGATRVLHRGLVTGTMSLSPDGRQLVFSQRELRRNYYEFSDLWILDLAGLNAEQLTRGLRATDPDWSPDSHSIVFVINRTSTTDIALLDLRDRTVRYLTDTMEPTGYSRPRFSPDGRYIAVSVNRPDRGSEIEILDTRTGWVIPVTAESHAPGSAHRVVALAPSWSPAGQWLYYVTDRSGVFNIHAWSPDHARSYRCTNARWGFFEPAVSPDNRSIAVTAFTPDGHDIAVLPLDPAAWTPDTAWPVPGSAGPRVRPETRDRESAAAGPLYHYNPLASLAPALWLPLPIPGEDGWTFGAITFGWDALQLHRYTLAAGWQTGDKPGPRLIADYTWAGLRPGLALETDLTLERQELAVFARLPFRRTRKATSFSLGSRLTAHPRNAADPVRVRWTTGYARSSARRYRFGVAPAEGGTINVGSVIEHRSALGARNRLSVFHDFRRWFGLPGHSSLRARVAFGISSGDASADSAWRLVPGPAPLGVRGFADESEPAARVLLAGAEYRLPLLRVERGIGTAPVFLANLNAAGFIEAGLLLAGLTPTAKELEAARLGTGLELRADLVLGHAVPTQFALGAALGTRPGDWKRSGQIYFGIESSLISGLFGRQPFGPGIEPGPGVHPVIGP